MKVSVRMGVNGKGMAILGSLSNTEKQFTL